MRGASFFDYRFAYAGLTERALQRATAPPSSIDNSSADDTCRGLFHRRNNAAPR